MHKGLYIGHYLKHDRRQGVHHGASVTSSHIFRLDNQSSRGEHLDYTCSIGLHSDTLQGMETQKHTYDNCCFIGAVVVVHGHHDMGCLMTHEGLKVG